MAQKPRNGLLLTFAWAVVPIAFGISALAYFRHGLNYADSNYSAFWAAYGSGLILGVLSIFDTDGGSLGGKTLHSVCYVAVMGVVLFLVAFVFLILYGHK